MLRIHADPGSATSQRLHCWWVRLGVPPDAQPDAKAQRPQKLVRIHFPERTALVCVRPVLAGLALNGH